MYGTPQGKGHVVNIGRATTCFTCKMWQYYGGKKQHFPMLVLQNVGKKNRRPYSQGLGTGAVQTITLNLVESEPLLRHVHGVN